MTHYAVEQPGLMLFKWREFVDDIVYGVGESTQLHRTPSADYKASTGLGVGLGVGLGLGNSTARLAPTTRLARGWG